MHAEGEMWRKGSEIKQMIVVCLLLPFSPEQQFPLPLYPLLFFHPFIPLLSFFLPVVRLCLPLPLCECMCVSFHSVIKKLSFDFQGRVMGVILGYSVRSSSHQVPLPKSQVPVWTSLYTHFSLDLFLSISLSRSLFFCTIWYQRHDN